MTKRRKIITGILVFILLLIIAGSIYLFTGRKISDASGDVIKGDLGTESLVVYFSRQGEILGDLDAVTSATANSNQGMNDEDVSDTEAAARMIRNLTGADLYQIHTEHYYRKSFMGTAATAWVENTFHMRPKLAALPDNLDDYDTIYIGYPIWWFNAPMAVGTFLESYDLSGKTVIPFCTSQDNDIEVSMDFIRNTAAGAEVLEGHRIHEENLNDVAAWLHQIGVTTKEISGQMSSKEAESQTAETESENVTQGTENYKGFVLDNVLHSEDEGDIHYNLYVPESYDGSEAYALFLTLPGYQGLYFQGVGENLRTENIGFTAQEYNPEMIIAAPQLDDWGETSARQTIALTEYLLSAYNIDQSKVYVEGYSGGGETMSLVMGMRPELYTAYLQGSSQWDGAYDAVVENRIPVYLVVGESDEYYGSEPSEQAYQNLHDLYEKEGLSDKEIDKLLVLDVKDSAYFKKAGVTNQHGQGGKLFFEDEKIMSWLFEQQKA